ncbi:MAG: right-handed parallel beta-helix repeat-containing protein [Patescibacteria group bacterium]
MLLGIFGLARSSLAATYYVATNGNDSNSGGQAQPWRTLQHAADAMIAGDTVLVQPGTYAGFMTTRPGTLTNPITFKANGTGVILNSRNPNTADIINIENWSGPAHDYIVVGGFEITGSMRAGVRVINGRGVVIKNNNIHNNGYWGILTGWTPDIQIINNIAYDQIGANAQHGIYVSNSNISPDNPIVRGNISYGNKQNGIQLNGDCGTTPTDGWIDGGSIEGNTVYNNGWKGLSIISVRNAIIQNNVIYNNGLNGGSAGAIHLVAETGANCTAYPSNNNIVVNNTVNETAIAGIRITHGANNVIFNNILISPNPYVNETGLLEYHDAASSIERTSASGLFVNTNLNDYRLSLGSPAINIGKLIYQGELAPATDFDGLSRPSGAYIDAGAYEYLETLFDTTSPAPPTGLSVI